NVQCFHETVLFWFSCIFLVYHSCGPHLIDHSVSNFFETLRLNNFSVFFLSFISSHLSDPVSIPHFTPEGVFLAAKWALIAAIGYWLLCVVLRVAIVLLKRVFWLLKVVVVGWLFIRIIGEPSASPNITMVRLTLLVVFCAVLSVAFGAARGTSSQWMENRLKNLEGRVKVLEKTEQSDD
uniref:Uncharacterized protein n=1 Tax=Electrophorus electricus TaxID=8005 RepID=A0A4W4GH35_ELEEL